MSIGSQERRKGVDSVVLQIVLLSLDFIEKKNNNPPQIPKVGAWGQERVTETWNAMFSHSAVLKPNLILQFPLKFSSKFLQPPDDPLVMSFEISTAYL